MNHADSPSYTCGWRGHPGAGAELDTHNLYLSWGKPYLHAKCQLHRSLLVTVNQMNSSSYIVKVIILWVEGNLARDYTTQCLSHKPPGKNFNFLVLFLCQWIEQRYTFLVLFYSCMHTHLTCIHYIFHILMLINYLMYAEFRLFICVKGWRTFELSWVFIYLLNICN